MPAPLPPPALDPVASPHANRKPSRPPEVDANRLSLALETLRHLLDAPQDAGDETRFPDIRVARRAVADSLDACRTRPSPGPALDTLLAAADALATHPAAALPDDAATTPPRCSGWQAGLVRVFAAPVWQTPDIPALPDLPAWLWPTYARHLFAAPAYFQTTAQETRWATHLVAHLEPILRMLEANRGSSSVRAVAGLAVSEAARWPAVGTDAQVLRRQQILGRLRSLLAPRLPGFSTTAQLPPPSSALRVGLLCDTSLATPGIFDPHHLKTLLDPERVDLSVYTADDLPADTAARVETLRLARLDAVVFAGDLTAPDGPLSALAAHRVAPRQFATALCPHTTGLPEIDVFLTDSAARPSAHGEQVAVLPAALAFATDIEESTLTRADFGLPERAPLFATTVHPAHFPGSTRARWHALLATDPQARLVVFADARGPALDLLLADLVREFGERLIISGNAPLAAAAVAALLRVIDTYVPSSAPGDRFTRDLAQRLGLHVPDAPARIDGLTFADALTSILENTCRTPDASAPLIASDVVCDLATRHEQGKHLLAFGRADRAVVHLLAAVDDPRAGPEVWHDLALALHADGKPTEAIQALETCVRLAPDRLDSWLLLRDWAAEYGHAELVTEIDEVVNTLAV